SATPARGTFGARAIAVRRILVHDGQNADHRPELQPGGAAYIMADPRHARENPMLSRRHVIGATAAAAWCISPARAQPKSTPPPRTLHSRAAAASTATGGNALRFGYDGTVPGPVLRVKQGEELHVQLVNDLPEPTSVHWSGVRLSNIMDGVAG